MFWWMIQCYLEIVEQENVITWCCHRVYLTDKENDSNCFAGMTEKIQKEPLGGWALRCA